MLRLIDVFGLWESLQSNFARKPVWGICAGTILIAQNVLVNDNLSSRDQKSDQKDTQKSFNLLPISVLRNGYGTQLESRHTEISGYTVSFIRAPVIQAVGGQNNKTENSEIEVLAEYDGAPVWVQGKGTQAKYMASTFHPELTQVYPSPMHQKFVDLVRNA
jgi:glutamine amidotransferase PdxT